MSDFSTYQSPLAWRYGSDEMRRIWSEREKRLLWRRVWVALAEVQSEFGLVTPEQLADLRAHMDAVDVPRALEIEAEIHHDVMAELKTFAGQAPLGGKVLHLGATSADITDNADALRLRRALDLVLSRLAELLRLLADLIEAHAEAPIMGFTHLQPAEPTTLGYRLALYAQDLFEDYRDLKAQRAALRGKGFKGAVGTGASYAKLLGAENLPEFERRLSEKLDLPFYPVAAQTTPRKQEYRLLCALAALGASLHKFAFDLRILQSPPLGELSEPFGEKQVGSSAMPFKRNPVRSEKMNSLARLLATLPRPAWDNAALSLLERTLDDSANRRLILPQAFLLADELLIAARRILSDLRVDEGALRRTLSLYAPFAATERLLMALVKSGADRQAMHERIRQHAMRAWEAIRRGEPNPLAESLGGDEVLRNYLSEGEIRALLKPSAYVGDAPRRARELRETILREVAPPHSA
ncbi:MAG: adenylosuccinate lyase [Anaerolineae bacterium]|nr:MAG: adenylosuccinate lyase [Anaerolineae bacterium]